jgi:hypothetical protein
MRTAYLAWFGGADSNVNARSSDASRCTALHSAAWQGEISRARIKARLY